MHKKILNEWKKVGIKYFWGDFLDSRFYICHLISKKKSKVILDIGCGAGVILNSANSEFKIGVDGDMASLRAAQNIYHNFNLIQSDVRFLPFKNEFFQDVLAVHIISQLATESDRKKVSDEIIRITKAGGNVIISGSNRRSKFFAPTHSNEQRLSYLHYSESLEYFEKKFKMTTTIGYGAYSKFIMGFLKRCVYWLPEGLIDSLQIEKILYQILGSKKFLKDGRSYVMIGEKE